MRLQAAANRFNDVPCLDAYGTAVLFKCQTDLADGNKRDSVTAERRTISVAPGTTLPARRAVKIGDSIYLLGNETPDFFGGQHIRTEVVAQEAPNLATIHTFEGICLNHSGQQAYTNLAWVKNLVDSTQSSLQTPEFQAFFAGYEGIAVDQLIVIESKAYLVKVVFPGPAGYDIAMVEEMPTPWLETASVTVGTFDPVSETRSGSTVSVRVLRLRWESFYRYKSTVAPKYAPGDIQVMLAKSAVTPAVGMVLPLSDGNWKVASISDEGLVWSCRAARQ